jgi:hypothetical protein
MLAKGRFLPIAKERAGSFGEPASMIQPIPCHQLLEHCADGFFEEGDFLLDNIPDSLHIYAKIVVG